VFGPRLVTLKRKKTALETISERAKGKRYRLTMLSETSLPSAAAVLPIPQSLLDKHQRHNRYRAAITEALDILKSVAGQDAGGARRMNGVGFNKADTTVGHRLSRLPIDRVMKDRGLAEPILAK
jgi:hypothetical protein